MAPIAYNPAALKAMLYVTVPCAATLGLTHVLKPSALVSAFGKEANKSPYPYSDGFMGAVFLAFATSAAIGLLTGDHGAFVSLIFVQFFYKFYHLCAMALGRAPPSPHNLFYAIGWLAFMAGDVWVFASAMRGEEQKKKSAAEKKST